MTHSRLPPVGSAEGHPGRGERPAGPTVCRLPWDTSTPPAGPQSLPSWGTDRTAHSRQQSTFSFLSKDGLTCPTPSDRKESGELQAWDRRFDRREESKQII